MPTITGIKPQKKSEAFYNVFVDEKFAFSISDLQISLLGLKAGQNITKKDLRNLQTKAGEKKAYGRALYYLKFRPRSEKEVKDYLAGKGFDEHSIAMAVKKLQAENLINDEDFANQWIKNRLEFRHYPLRIIRQELREKGVAGDVLDKVFAALDDDAELKSIIYLVNQKRKQSKYRELPKLKTYLAGKGFSYQLIKQATEQDLSGENHYLNKNSNNHQPE